VQQPPGPEDEEEASLEEMETAFERLLALRETAKGLPDEERREVRRY